MSVFLILYYLTAGRVEIMWVREIPTMVECKEQAEALNRAGNKAFSRYAQCAGHLGPRLKQGASHE